MAVAPVAGGKKGKGGASRLADDNDEFLDEEAKEYNKSEDEEDVEEQEDYTKDAMIKKPKKSAGAAKPKAASNKAAKAPKPKAAPKKK